MSFLNDKDRTPTGKGRMQVYFSDFFEVSQKVLNDYGALNVSLINDIPLFIDPFLLYDSPNQTYKSLHDGIISYLRFLLDKEKVNPNSLPDKFFLFPEIRETWLGFSQSGNRGTGLGKHFAEAMRKNLHLVFPEGGASNLTQGNHLEKLGLFCKGVGRDHISDFVSNLIKHYLLEYTQEFARTRIKKRFVKSVAIRNVRFDFKSEKWTNEKYDLPCLGGSFVLLTPKDILTKDESWINRPELIDNIEDVFVTIDNVDLRNKINEHFRRLLPVDAEKRDKKLAAAIIVNECPVIADYFIREKERNAAEAHESSAGKVAETESLFINNLKVFMVTKLADTEFYSLGDSYEESMKRLLFLKQQIEFGGGYKIFYKNGKPINNETDLHILFRLTWFASVHDVNREVNNGRGEADFIVSKGSADKTVIEFKLAKNTQLKKGLEVQVEIYKTSSSAKRGIKAIVFFSEDEEKRVMKILKEMGVDDYRKNGIVLIDARADNKPSGSKAR